MLSALLRRRRAGAAPTFFLLTVGSAFCYALTFTLNIIYMVTVVGLDPLQLVLVGTVLEATCFVLEVPTGLVADLRSRRLSIIIGFVLVGIGLGLQGSVPAFWAVLVAQVIWGAGVTFTSGAVEAWVTDEVGEERVPAVFTRGQQLHLAGTIAGVVGAGALSLIDVRLPLIVSGAGFLVLAALLARIMPEQNFQPAAREDTETFSQLVATARAGLALTRRRQVVRSILIVSVFTGLSAEAFDRLWQFRLVTDFSVPGILGSSQPYLWFVAIELAGLLIALGCSLAVNHFGLDRLNTAHPHRILALLAVAQVAGIAILALSGWLWLAVGALWLKATAAALAAPILAAWMNRNLDPAVRATVLSFQSQANAFGEVAGGPPLGVLGRQTSASVAILASAVLLSPVVAIFARLRPDRITRPGAADPADFLDQRPHRLEP